jgi:hypothetical protein
MPASAIRINQSAMPAWYFLSLFAPGKALPLAKAAQLIVAGLSKPVIVCLRNHPSLSCTGLSRPDYQFPIPESIQELFSLSTGAAWPVFIRQLYQCVQIAHRTAPVDA